MARRIIRTIDGQIFAGSSNHFQDRKGYVLYKKGAFRSVRINKRGITSDNINGLPTSVIMMLMLFALIALLMGVLLLSGGPEIGEIQNNPYSAASASLVI